MKHKPPKKSPRKLCIWYHKTEVILRKKEPRIRIITDRQLTTFKKYILQDITLEKFSKIVSISIRKPKSRIPP